MTRPRVSDWILMGLAFGVLPIAYYLLVHRPIQARIDGHRARQQAADARIQELPNVQPLASGEREALVDPAAPWRARLAVLQGEADRLEHYHRVVTDLHGRLQASGVVVEGIRSTWDPIQGSFTLPAALAPSPTRGSDAEAQASLQGWVLEARIGAPSLRLFEALEALPRVGPVLEPVGFRWEAGAEGVRQHLVLRNLVLVR